MKITRLAGLLATGTLLAATAACGGSGGGSPEAAAEKILQAVVDEDARAMCEGTLLDGEPRTDDEVDECVEEAEESEEEAERFREEADEEMLTQLDEQTEEMKDTFRTALDNGPSEVGDEEDGEVVVTYEVDGEEAPITTKEFDGEWYVDMTL